MAEPESIRSIARRLITSRNQRRERMAKIQTTEAIVGEMDHILRALQTLPPVEGAYYPRDPYALTGIDKMLLESMGINAWD
jgi:hypothetical protein